MGDCPKPATQVVMRGLKCKRAACLAAPLYLA
jgi:hypothetical protein